MRISDWSSDVCSDLAVAAADTGQQLEFEGALLQRGQHAVAAGDQQVGGADKLKVEAGIQHVRRGHAMVHEAGGRDELSGQVGQEGDEEGGRASCRECVSAYG